MMEKLRRLVYSGAALVVLGCTGFVVCGCTIGQGKGFGSLPPTFEPAFVEKDPKDPKKLVDINNGYKVVGWISGQGDQCSFKTQGVGGTITMEPPGDYSWVWITSDNPVPSDLEDGSFLRLTDDEGRVYDSSGGASTQLMPLPELKDEKLTPRLALVFRIPARWSSTPKAKIELFSHRSLLASWQASNLECTPNHKETPQDTVVTVGTQPVAVKVETEFKCEPSGQIRSRTYTYFTTKEPEDQDHRWIYVIDEPKPMAGSVLVGRGSSSAHMELPDPVEPGRSLTFKGTAYEFSRAVKVEEAGRCQMTVEDGNYTFSNPWDLIVSMPHRGGRGHIPSFKVTSTPGKDKDHIIFRLPVRWKGEPAEPLSAETTPGTKYRVILATNRGKVVESPSGQSDTFDLSMTREEADYLIGNRFAFTAAFETRDLVAAAPFNLNVVARESGIFTLSSAMERSDSWVDSN